MVQEGRGHAAIDVWAIGEAALWSAFSFAERSVIALLRVQGYSMQEVARRLGRVASTISRELRRNAATRSGGLGVSCDDSAMARRARCSPPKAAKLSGATRVKNRMSRNGWLASLWLRVGLRSRPGRVLESRRHDHGRTGDGQTPGARSRSPVACRWTSRTTRPCASATVYLSSAVRSRSRRVAPRTDGLPAHPARVADAEGAQRGGEARPSSLPRS